MENMLNKLRSTMSSAASNAVSNAVSIASQVSNYLPGNPVTREFEATSHIASAGTGLSWKVYSGYKKSSRQDVSLFVFEKRSLDRWDRQDREQFLEMLRRGVAQLTRIKHPQILTVQHPLEESRDSLAFATEPVLASLANILGSNTINAPSPLPLQLQGYKLHDVEIKYGFVQLCEGLQFLHQSVKVVHCGVCPENIVVNQQGAWKLFGFDFCLPNTAPPDQKAKWQFPEYRPSLPNALLPQLDYLAPECITDSSGVGPPADMFSVGALITAVFNGGKAYTGHKGDLEAYKKVWKELSRLTTHQLVSVPEGLREKTRRLLLPEPTDRPHAQELSQHDYFCDIGVKTLSYLDQMFQWDNVQKSKFYKGLPQLIPQLPHRVAMLRIVPALVQESVNPTMVPFVLPVILQVAERATDEEFVAHILPHLKPIMKIEEPIQVLVQLMQKMSLLLSKTPAADVRSDLLPLLYRALDTNNSTLQEMCLSALPACSKQLDKQTMKAQLLPRIQKLCLTTSNLSVRVSCLVCVGRMLTQLDKWLVLDGVVPFLTQLPSREAPVIMAAVGILQVTLQSSSLGLTKEVMANTLLPFLIPLTIENCLSPQQHATFMALVREMIDKVEAEHKTKLEYLNTIKDEQKNLHQLMPDATSTTNATYSSSGKQEQGTEHDAMFAGLGLGQYVSPTHSNNSSNGSVSAAGSLVRSPTSLTSAAAASPPAAASTISPTSPTSSTLDKTPQAKGTSSKRDLTSTLVASPLPPPPQNSVLLNNNNNNTSMGNGMFSANTFPSAGIIQSPPAQRSTPTLNNSFNANFAAMQCTATNNNNNNRNNVSKAAATAAFDNLLPTPPKNRSMNQMPTQIAPPPMMQSPGGFSAMNTAPAGVAAVPFNNIAMGNTGVSTTNMGVNTIGINPMGMNNMSMGTMNMGMNNGNMGMNAVNGMGMGGMVMGGGMMSPRQAQNNSSQSSSSFKPLTSTDINDFLS
uniref:SCY1-like protein 2 n=2 Tax=Hirondellea gigas TaxID=1518452 RepID=A0A6A7G441_9CRUS